MEVLAIGLLAFVAIGYFVLAGTDLGTGMALFFLGRNARERRLVIASFAPFFLGNEVWLILTAGLLVGLFPTLEGELFTELFVVVAALLTGWVIRDAGLWLRGRLDAVRWQTFWDGAITTGSWLVTGAWGWAIGSLLLYRLEPEASLFPLIGVGAAWALFGLHGAAFAALRLHDAPHGRARALSGPSGERITFLLTSAGMTLLPLVAAARLPLRDNVTESASWLAVTTAVVLPLLVAAQAWVWWLFRHRVTGPTYL
ncbi:cytochrome d ubiquinol oxidase subunit II [Actinomadura alba]|uniref:Cytochrome d ubiquinol oxidase subunit II n=1 Tax=Actinomadura alba TaxID=406431 RepID=A0ABR7LU22_9ACTN|nr:cytochrome d ubiquinol oxidase subunit II [Actinomadura alba]MBC6468352.1 cytochrome d ubiquinol oxidase subunit II [Actinomadura alba]